MAGAFRPDAAQRMHQPVGMMRALGVARDLGADHARRIGIVRGAADAADGVRVENFHLERAGRRAIVRAGRGGNARTNELVHRCILAEIAEPLHGGATVAQHYSLARKPRDRLDHDPQLFVRQIARPIVISPQSGASQTRLGSSTSSTPAIAALDGVDVGAGVSPGSTQPNMTMRSPHSLSTCGSKNCGRIRQ